MQFRIAAYGEVRDENGQVLLTRRKRAGREAGPWHLPGGVLDHGEPPKRAAGRLVGEHTGYEVAVGAPLEAVAAARRGAHTTAIIYPPQVVNRPATDFAETEAAEWVDPARAAAEP